MWETSMWLCKDQPNKITAYEEMKDLFIKWWRQYHLRLANVSKCPRGGPNYDMVGWYSRWWRDGPLDFIDNLGEIGCTVCRMRLADITDPSMNKHVQSVNHKFAAVNREAERKAQVQQDAIIRLTAANLTLAKRNDVLSRQNLELMRGRTP